jgi:hypothetical protein
MAVNGNAHFLADERAVLTRCSYGNCVAGEMCLSSEAAPTCGLGCGEHVNF